MFDRTIAVYREELPGYVAVTRGGPCLDAAGKQVSSCAFRHNDDQCSEVACSSRDRSDGRMVQFYRSGDFELRRLRRVVGELEKLISHLEAHPEYIPSIYGLCSTLFYRICVPTAALVVKAAAKSWPMRYGDDAAYPVEGRWAYREASDMGQLWEGENRERRISLAKHVLTWIWFNRVEALRVLRGE